MCQAPTGPSLPAAGKRKEQRPVLLGGAGVWVGQGAQGRGAGREGQRVASRGSPFGSYREGREAVTKFGAENGLFEFTSLEMPRACPGRGLQRCGQWPWREAGRDFRLDTGVRRQTLGPVRGWAPGRLRLGGRGGRPHWLLAFPVSSPSVDRARPARGPGGSSHVPTLLPQACRPQGPSPWPGRVRSSVAGRVVSTGSGALRGAGPSA